MSFMKSFTTTVVISTLIGSTHLSYSMEPENKINHEIVLAPTLVNLNFFSQGYERMTELENHEFLQKLSNEGITGVEPSFEPDVGQRDFSIVFLNHKKVDVERTLFPILVSLKNNTTVTALNLRSCDDSRLGDYVADILKTNKTLKSLNLKGLRGYSIHLNSTYGPPKETLNFEGQVNLTTLNISSLWLDLNAFTTIISSLRNCMSLTSLNISGTYLTYKIYPETVEDYEKREESETRGILSLLPVSLESLKMNRSDLHDVSMRVFSNWLSDQTKLTSLELNTNGFGDLGARELSEGLSKHTTLSHLDVSGNYIKQEGIVELLNRINPQLVSIDISKNTFLDDINACKAVRNWESNHKQPKLICSYVRSRNPDNGLYELRNFWYCTATIKEASRPVIIEEVTRPVILASTLVSLNFSHQASAEEKMTENETDQFLQRLSWAGKTDVEPSGGEYDFSKVYLDDKKVDFERTLFPILVSLKNNTTVTALNLGFCRDSRLWDYVADLLKANKTLKSLNLGGLGDYFGRLNSTYFYPNEMLNFEGQVNLTMLNISWLWVDMKTFIPILSSLRNCMSLTSLDISGKYRALKQTGEAEEDYQQREENETHQILGSLPASLETLIMNWSDLHDASMRVFSSWLPEHTKLTSLQLGKNKFGDLGARELSQGLFKNTTLTHLDVSSNDIQFNGMHAILLRSGSSIKLINFSYNPVVLDNSMHHLLDSYQKSFPELVIKHDTLH